MNTFFKILWFEDEVTWFNMEKLRINSILQEHYLVPEIVRKDGDDFDISEITGNEYDLIMMDYKLVVVTKGMPPIDSVYLTKRDYTIFTEKAEKLITKIVKRSEDIVNLRGFVLDNTSDFELRIKEILNICWQKFSDEQR